MRRTLGAIALGLGALLLVSGFMAKPVLYTQLATVPLNYKSTSVSVGRDMSVLRLWSDDAKVGHYDKLTGVTVQSTRQVLGIPGRVPADKQATTAFWQTGVKSTAVGVGDLTYSMETVSFDRLTGVATNCCGDQVSIGDLEKPDAMKDITHEGGYFKFPFDVQKQSYSWWDGDLGKATAAKFVRTEDLFGTETYGLNADSISLAKQITSAYFPLSAVMMNDKIYDVLVDQSRKIGTFGHGNTYAGHPVAASVALETLKIYEEIGLIDHVRAVEPVFLAELGALRDHPLVGDFTGVGRPSTQNTTHPPAAITSVPNPPR